MTLYVKNCLGLLFPSNINPQFVEQKTQLDVTECFIVLMICSTFFGHFYAHRQELEIMCVITAYGVHCLVAVVGGQVQGSRL